MRFLSVSSAWLSQKGCQFRRAATPRGGKLLATEGMVSRDRCSSAARRRVTGATGHRSDTRAQRRWVAAVFVARQPVGNGRGTRPPARSRSTRLVAPELRRRRPGTATRPPGRSHPLAALGHLSKGHCIYTPSKELPEEVVPALVQRVPPYPPASIGVAVKLAVRGSRNPKKAKAIAGAEIRTADLPITSL